MNARYLQDLSPRQNGFRRGLYSTPHSYDSNRPCAAGNHYFLDRFCPETRLMVHKPLALHALNSIRHALTVGNLAAIPAERKLGAVSVQMLLAELMKYAVVAPFEKAEKAFGRGSSRLS